jgi:hypothetical protein
VRCECIIVLLPSSRSLQLSIEFVIDGSNRLAHPSLQNDLPPYTALEFQLLRLSTPSVLTVECIIRL